MENTGINREVIDEIKSLAERYNLKKVVLFGSRARGTFQRASDIDLLVYDGDVSGFALAVEEETSTLLKFDVLNGAVPLSEKLLQEIERDGVVLYEKI